MNVNLDPDDDYFNDLLNQSENDITCPESKIFLDQNIKNE